MLQLCCKLGGSTLIVYWKVVIDLASWFGTNYAIYEYVEAKSIRHICNAIQK